MIKDSQVSESVNQRENSKSKFFIKIYSDNDFSRPQFKKCQLEGVVNG